LRHRQQPSLGLLSGTDLKFKPLEARRSLKCHARSSIYLRRAPLVCAFHSAGDAAVDELDGAVAARSQLAVVSDLHPPRSYATRAIAEITKADVEVPEG